MGRIYEALARSTTNTTNYMINAKPSDGTVTIPVGGQSPFGGMIDTQDVESIKTNFLMRYAGRSIKTIMFSGVSSGCGTSTTAVKFAACLAKDTRLNVLLIDINLRSPSLQCFFEPRPGSGLLEQFEEENPNTLDLRTLNPGQLHVITSGGRCENPVQLLESDQFHLFLEKARNRLDYVIFDGPISSAYPEPKMLCRKLDGVVLVVEAGKSRRQAASRIVKEFEDAGGQVLGTILNKRKYHIPAWLYQRL